MFEIWSSSRGAAFLALAVIGTLVPYAFFAGFFAAEGLAGDFLGAAFANGAAGGLTADLLVASLVFWVFLFTEGRRVGVRQRWLYVALNLVVGLSCALPLFLWARARAGAAVTPGA
jgi:hypothetical protein